MIDFSGQQCAEEMEGLREAFAVALPALQAFVDLLGSMPQHELEKVGSTVRVNSRPDSEGRPRWARPSPGLWFDVPLWRCIRCGEVGHLLADAVGPVGEIFDPCFPGERNH